MSSRADRVLEAFAASRLISPFTDDDPAFDLDAGYAVAREVHEARVAGGATPAGRKIGFTNRTLWPVFDIWAPIWAYVYDTTIVAGETVEVGGLMQPLVEPEVQLHLCAAPPRTGDEAELLACVDHISLGFEIVQCPYPDWRFKAADSVAAGSLHARLLIGPKKAVADIEDCAAKLRAFTVSLRRDGEPVEDGGGELVLGSPLLALAHLIEVLADDAPLQAGEIVTTGTLTAPPPAVAGEEWDIAVEGIELESPRLVLR